MNFLEFLLFSVFLKYLRMLTNLEKLHVYFREETTLFNEYTENCRSQINQIKVVALIDPDSDRNSNFQNSC